MANNIKGITVEIGGDTTKLDSALKDVNKTSKSLQSELKEVQKQLKLDPSNTELLSQKSKILKEDIQTTSEKLKTLKDVQGQVEQQFKSGDLGEEKYRAYNRELEETKIKLKDLKDQHKDFGSVVGQQLQVAGDKVKGVGDKITGVGQKIAPVSATAAGLIAGAVKSFSEVDEGMDTIVKKTGATGDSLDGLQGIAKNIFGSMPVDMDKVGIAVGEVNTKFGSTGTELENLSTEFLKFSEVNDTDLNSSIDNTNKIMTQFGVDSSQTSNVLGMMTAKAQETGISVDDLMGSVQTNGSTFKEMGLNLGQSIDLLSQFEKNGVNADTAMAGLKKSVMNYTKEGKSTDEALKLTIDSIKNAKTDTEALATAQSVFGTKGAAEMANGIRDGRISLDDLSGSMDTYGGKVDETFSGTEDGVDKIKTALNNGKLAFADFGQVISDSIAPILDKVIGFIKDLTEKIKAMSPEQKEQIVKIVAIIAAVAPLLIIGGKIVALIGGIISAIGFLMSPIGLVILAITGIIAAAIAIKTHWEQIGKFFSDLWSGIQQTFAPIGAWFQSVFSAAAQVVKTVWGGITGFFGGIWNGICAVFGAVGGFFGDIFNGAVNIIQGAWSGITGFFGGIWDGITGVFGTVGDWFGQVFGAAADAIQSAWSGIAGFFQSIWDGIGDGFRSFVDFFVSGINTVIGALDSIHVDIPSWFPVGGGSSFGFNIPMVPYLANGGIVDKATLAMIGEAGREVVVPLDRNTGWIDELASKINSSNGKKGGGTQNFYGDIHAESKGDQRATLQQLQFLEEV